MNKEDKTKSLPQKEERKPQGAPASGGMEQDLPQLLAELQALRQRERDWVFREYLEKLATELSLSKAERERMLDLAAKSKTQRVSADLPDYIMERDTLFAPALGRSAAH